MIRSIARSSSVLLKRASLARQLSYTKINHNVVQDLYLKELSNVKLSPITAKDAEGNVKPWSDPIKPQIPELEGQGADALKAYSQEAVETKQSGAETTEETNTEEEDWLVLDDAEENAHGH